MQFLSYLENSCRPLSRFHHHQSLTIPQVDEYGITQEAITIHKEREKGRISTAKPSLLEVLLFLFLFKSQKKLPIQLRQAEEGGGVQRKKLIKIYKHPRNSHDGQIYHK